MECPYCKKEMTLGYMQSSREVFWSKEVHKILSFSHSKKDITLSKDFFLNPTKTPMYYCEECKKMIIDL